MIGRVFIAFILGANAAAESPSATDVTVRLASTQVLHSITVVPMNARMRACDACAAELVPAKLLIQSKGLQLAANERIASSLSLDGSLRVDASGQQFVAAGKWKITSAADGLHLTLTIPSERYVKAVLMGESPAEPIEWLKAEAVAIRTFALMNLRRHGAEGLCDSTHCQALRLDQVPDVISEAVEATAGETLWSGHARAETYFTQSCGGTSAVWPEDNKPWLTVHADPYCEKTGSAWRSAIAEADLRRALSAEGWKVEQPIRAIRIVSRDASGRAAKVLVSGIAMDAPTLRFAVNRQLGWNQIRSDLYQVTLSEGRAVFEGKGFGHGVGLCQFGAREMAREGMNYRQILDFYFPRMQVRIEPEDTGWREFSLSGFKVRSTVNFTSPVPAGQEVNRFTVTVYPTTELFRQATNQPGWMLGSTSGTRIALQPVAVLEKHGGIDRVLKHELMHAVIEQQTAPQTPLWLREGLAEVLAGEAGDGTMPVEQMERGLRYPRSLAESQAVHLAAAARVHALVAKYGLEAVWGWVRSGRAPAGL